MTMQLVPEHDSGINGVVVAQVRSLGARYGVRQVDLARLFGVAQTQISQRLTGKRPFSLAEIELLAEFFGTSPGYLMGISEGPAPRDPRRNDQGSDVRTRDTGQ